jgi:hypothetical protein
MSRVRLESHDDRSRRAVLKLRPALGMMAGLGVLKSYSYVFNHRHRTTAFPGDEMDDVFAEPELESDPLLGRQTLHRAKGLEAEFVAVVEDGAPPDDHPLRNVVYGLADLPGSYSEEANAMRAAGWAM